MIIKKYIDTRRGWLYDTKEDPNINDDADLRSTLIHICDKDKIKDFEFRCPSHVKIRSANGDWAFNADSWNCCYINSCPFCGSNLEKEEDEYDKKCKERL